jgi:hypothetical protein
MNNQSQYILLFLVGGFTLIGIKYASEFVSPVLAGIIGALPIGLFSAYYLISHRNRKGYLKNYIKQTTLTLALATLYLYGLEVLDDKTIYILTLLLWIVYSYISVMRD